MTDIESGYVAQGYSLPDGMTWEAVAERRAQYDIGAIYVPVCTVPGVACGWGVPIIDGAFLTHP